MSRKSTVYFVPRNANGMPKDYNEFREAVDMEEKNWTIK